MGIITGSGSLDMATKPVSLADGPVAQPTSDADAMAVLTCTIAQRNNLPGCTPEIFQSLTSLFMEFLFTNLVQLVGYLHIA